MDAITLLENDHRTVEDIFTRFEEADTSDHQTLRQLVDQMIEELSVHAAIEEQVFYPAVREAVPETEDDVLEGLEEHHIVKWTLSELQDMDPSHERFVAKVSVLMESVRHHVEEEEGELFPEVRKALDDKRLDQIGDALELAKTRAPAEPRPEAPDTPPGNVPVS
ncbi:MAG TPA: hemerythrin domain-containing protein [Acidimicrobiales bacterium]|nr:hemerythrin domain-containing protein [Acidimicrobiales bacterium]